MTSYEQSYTTSELRAELERSRKARAHHVVVGVLVAVAIIVALAVLVLSYFTNTPVNGRFT